MSRARQAKRTAASSKLMRSLSVNTVMRVVNKPPAQSWTSISDLISPADGVQQTPHLIAPVCANHLPPFFCPCFSSTTPSRRVVFPIGRATLFSTGRKHPCPPAQPTRTSRDVYKPLYTRRRHSPNRNAPQSPVSLPPETLSTACIARCFRSCLR